MHQMRPSVRLWWCFVIVAVSVAYTVVLTQDKDFASAIALGYIALILTILMLTQMWKKEKP